MEFGPATRGLVLVVDSENDNRPGIRKLFGSLGFDVVHAFTGLVALELIQRLPQSFQLVLIDLALPGLAGQVVIDTLRLFRPELPVLCMSDARTVGAAVVPQRCLSRPLQAEELRMRLEGALSGADTEWEPVSRPTADAVVRARLRYAEGRGLAEAALELARGYAEG
jgi:DNA-binding response OmpR family regulator